MSDLTLTKLVDSMEIPIHLDEFTLSLPRTAKIIHVGSYYNKVHIWYEYMNDPVNSTSKERKFRAIKTGVPFDKKPLDSTQYIGTFTHGRKMRHLYEDK